MRCKNRWQLAANWLFSFVHLQNCLHTLSASLQEAAGLGAPRDISLPRTIGFTGEQSDLLTGSSAGSALLNGPHASSDHFVAISLLVMVPIRWLTLLPLSFYQVCQRPRVSQ